MSKLKYNKTLVVSDNPFLIQAFHKLSSAFEGLSVTYACAANNHVLLSDTSLPVEVTSIDLKKDYPDVVLKFDLVLSLHCKQLFPDELVKKVKCINVHPGYNPYNRGWFPQVFSILNGMPAGATIHEIDEQLDHGNIIAQREVKVHSWETSIDVYNRVQSVEVDLLKENLQFILQGVYQTVKPEEEGNINLKRDFKELCELELSKEITIGDAINFLRALTHGKYNNAFFIDPETGSKVYVKITLEKEL